MNIAYIKIIIGSFYRPDVYIEAFKNGRGFGLRYLFIITIFASSLIAIKWFWEIGKIDPTYAADKIVSLIISEPDLSFEDNLNRFLNILHQIPEIQIEDGIASTTSLQPYSITDPVSGYDMALIDTTGKFKSLEGTDALFLLTDTRLIVRNDQGREVAFQLNDLEKRYNIEETSLNDALFIVSQIPSFKLNKGQFETESNKLYKILDRKSMELAEIGPDAALGEKLEPLLAISASEINYKSIFNKNGSTIKAVDLNEQLLFEMIKSATETIRKLMLWGMPVLALPFIVLSSFVFNTIMLTFYAFIGHSFIKIMKLGQFEYKDVMRISAVAITPMLIASNILPQIIPSQGTIYFLISIGYLYYAIKSITTRQ